MKRKTVVMAVAVTLLLAVSSMVAHAEKGSLPHNGGCASYCARAVIHRLGPDGWVPLDANGDGTVQHCLHESMYMTDPAQPVCIKAYAADGLPGCPEVRNEKRCVLPEDGWGLWCKLMHGQDTHYRGHDHDAAGVGPGW